MQFSRSTACFICGVHLDLPLVPHPRHVRSGLADRLNPFTKYRYRVEFAMSALALIGGIVLSGVIAVGIVQIVDKTTIRKMRSK